MAYTSTSVYFSHPEVGDLAIENGIDEARWGYNMNTAVYPTYGGEVVQMLSVYIGDLSLAGTVATYSQCEAIYSYFARYFQVATQGKNPTPNAGTSAYNLIPVTFSYPQRDWRFSIYPKEAPGFAYDWDAVGRVWQLGAFVEDDSVDTSIRDAIKDQAIENMLNGQSDAGGGTVSGTAFTKINGEISPNSGNPDTNPFQTYDEGAQKAAAAVQKDADYYTSLIPAYAQGDFSQLTGGLGSTPSSIFTGGSGGGSQVKVPKKGHH